MIAKADHIKTIGTERETPANGPLDHAETGESCAEDRLYLYALMNSLPFVIYFKDKASCFTKINKECARRLGLSRPEEAIGKSDCDFFSGYHAAEALEDERAVLLTGRPVIEKEEKETWPDGSTTWAVTTKMPLTDRSGKTIGTFGVSRDVTESKRSEEASRFLGSLVEASDDAIVGLDASGNVVSWNRGAKAIYGYAAGEVIGSSGALLLCSCEGEEFAWIVDEIRRAQRILHFETRHLHKDGRRLEVSMTISPIKDQWGEVTGAAMVAQDITERKKMESDLRQAQKLESIGQLAAGIAHEINTPIQYVGDNNSFLSDAFTTLRRIIDKHHAFTERMRDRVDCRAHVEELEDFEASLDLNYLIDEIPKAIEQSAEGVTRVANIVCAMKEFSHPDSFEKEWLDLNHAIRNTLAVCRNEWKYVADVEMALAPDLPLLFCRTGEIKQVVLNLVVNAAHAIGSANKWTGGGGLIKVSSSEESGCLKIQVEDNGTGISDAIKPQIFTPFFTTKEVGKGTGQGLCLARTIVVKKHGGSLTFETKEGVGTTFTVRIPLTLSASKAAFPEKMF